MKYESAKSGILIFLIALSLLLYYLLWTDQGGNIEAVDSGSTMEQERIGATKEIGQVVKPDRIYQHMEGDHYGTVSVEELNSLVDLLKQFSFDSFQNISSEVENVSQFMENRTNSIELRFPGDVPFGIYKNILGMEGDNSFDFDTIILSYTLNAENKAAVYFISQSNKRVYETSIAAQDVEKLEAFKKHVKEAESAYLTYFAYRPNDQYLIYLPKEKVEVNKYKYFTRKIESIRLKRALFSNPSIAQKEIYSNWEEYTDDSGLLRIYKDTHVVSFFKPSGITNELNNQNHIISNSIELMNQRGGWINNYLYVGNDDDTRVTFRLYNTNGMPVFNLTTQISDIRLDWENSIAQRLFTNNLVIINTNTPFDFSKETVSSGQDVLLYFQNNKKVKQEKIQNIVLGYNMQVDSQSIVSLQPTWFYQYDNKWYQLSSDGTGGNVDGLE